MSRELKGKVAIITGASRGIGKALASTCASLGINITIAARQEGPLKGDCRGDCKKDQVDVYRLPAMLQS